jgi:ABC-2 type transport system permease protein
MKSKFKKRDILALLAGIIIIVLLNVVSSLTFRRLDLTAEKRFTLTQPTIDLLNNIDDAVTIKVYLDGDLPAYFLKLRNATRDMLDEMRAFNGNIEYEFIDPSENPLKKDREKIYTQLAKKGLKYTQHDTKKEYYIFPDALITYKGVDIPVELLQVQNGLSKEAMCYNSINNLEYQFSNAFRKFDVKDKLKIGFIKGHGELSEIETDDIRTSLGEYYNVERVNIGGKVNSLVERAKDDKDTNKVVIKPKYSAIVIAKPDSAFNEDDKFFIDQYLMYGGKILWCIDNVFASMDSLQANPTTLAYPMQLNLEDMLFNYGVRINTNLVMDLNAAPIPVVTEMVDGKPIQKLFPWYFYPISLPTSKHPIVKNLNGIRMQFANTIDTVGTNKDIKKYVLLHTSKYSRYINAPSRISLNIFSEEPDEKQYDKRYLPMAILLEGFFNSNFKNRVSPQIDTSKVIGFKDRSAFSRQIVISDGDILRNDVSKTQGKIFPLDLDRFTGATYGNKTFIINALNFLCDDSGLISARAREVMVRPLDKKKIVKNKLNIQLTNVAFPTILVLLFGLIQYFLRKRRFAK